MYSLGALRFELLEPILENCDAMALIKFEQASPVRSVSAYRYMYCHSYCVISQHIVKDTSGELFALYITETACRRAAFHPDIWKRLCFRTYPLPAQQYVSDLIEETDSWRDVFFVSPFA